MLLASPVLVGERKDKHPVTAVFRSVQGGVGRRDCFPWSGEVFPGGDVCSEHSAGWERCVGGVLPVCLRGVPTLLPQAKLTGQSVNSRQNFQYRIASCPGEGGLL